jgi:hypothetical protein
MAESLERLGIVLVLTVFFVAGLFLVFFPEQVVAWVEARNRAYQRMFPGWAGTTWSPSPLWTRILGVFVTALMVWAVSILLGSEPKGRFGAAAGEPKWMPLYALGAIIAAYAFMRWMAKRNGWLIEDDEPLRNGGWVGYVMLTLLFLGFLAMAISGVIS